MGSSKIMILFLCFLILGNKVVTSDPLSKFCPNTTTSSYTQNSTYVSNLNTLLSSLSNSSTNSTTGFSNSTAGSGSHDIIYGLFLCRGDAPAAAAAAVCRDCVKTATSEVLTECPNRRRAIIWYDECMLRYSDQNIFGISDQSVGIIMRNTQNVTHKQRFGEVLSELTDDIANRASSGAQSTGKRFATKEANFTAMQRVYGLAQCTPDLSISGCNTCLRDAISRFPGCCDSNQGARVLFPSCNVRYELYPFYTIVASAPPPRPPPPTPDIPPPPSSSGEFLLPSITM